MLRDCSYISVPSKSSTVPFTSPVVFGMADPFPTEKMVTPMYDRSSVSLTTIGRDMDMSSSVTKLVVPTGYTIRIVGGSFMPSITISMGTYMQENSESQTNRVIESLPSKSGKGL